jgi:hypothetical protein
MNSLLATSVAGLAGITLALAAPGTALAANNVIKVDQGINKVRIGNSQKQVINKVGYNPKEIVTGVTADTGQKYKDLYFKHKFSVRIIKGYGVSAMTTLSDKPQTPDGIGVGSTKGQVKSTYDVNCDKVSSAMKICSTGPMDPVPGETSTVFRITNSLVTEITVAVFLD